MKRRRTLREIASESRRDPHACPRCGCRFWRVATVWRRADGTKVRSVYCNNCKFAKRTEERDADRGD